MLGKISLHLLLLYFIFSCTKKNEYKQFNGVVFGTTYHINYKSNVDYSKDILNILNKIDSSLSNYNELSTISKINNRHNNLIDNELEEVFYISKYVYEITDGYFDPSIHTILKQLNNFYKNSEWSRKIEKNNDTLCGYVGFDQVSLIKKNIVFNNNNTTLDFNAIAKGYAVDEVSDFLIKKNVKNYIVEIGGELIVRGVNSSRKKWTIGVEMPNEDNNNRKLLGTTSSSYLAMASSGNYRKFLIDKFGRKIVHTVNPISCSMEPNDLIGVSVISKTCALADAYATALMSMGKKKSLAFLSKHKKIKAILMFYNKEGGIEYELINNFPLQTLYQF